jgi:hypothetical protein
MSKDYERLCATGEASIYAAKKNMLKVVWGRDVRVARREQRF